MRTLSARVENAAAGDADWILHFWCARETRPFFFFLLPSLFRNERSAGDTGHAGGGLRVMANPLMWFRVDVSFRFFEKEAERKKKGKRKLQSDANRCSLVATSLGCLIAMNRGGGREGGGGGGGGGERS